MQPWFIASFDIGQLTPDTYLLARIIWPYCGLKLKLILFEVEQWPRAGLVMSCHVNPWSKINQRIIQMFFTAFGILRLFKQKTKQWLNCSFMPWKNKNRNHSINEVKKLGYERWLIFTVIGNMLLQQLWMNLCNKQWLLCSLMSSKKISIIQQLNQETGIWKILFL